MAKANVFWDRIAKRYARQPIANMAAYEEKLEIIKKYLRPKMRMMEFGCGTGSTALLLAPSVKEIHAIDVSPNMIGIANGKLDGSNISNVTFEVAGIDSFDAPEAGYDAVLGMNILHLVDDRDAMIGRVHEMLVSGGVFISSTACVRGWLRLMSPFFVLGRMIGWLPLLRFFSAADLEASIKRAGFRIEHLSRPGNGMAVFIVAKKTR